MIKVFAVAGSLRRASFNKMLLRAAQELAPAGMAIESFDLEGIPAYNQDLERTPPDSVKTMKAKVKASDAVLFVTPEYNFSIPGVLKNAIDWGSRPKVESCWAKKPAAIMGASTGKFGAARAQYHLRQCLVTLDMPCVNQPEVMVNFAADKFDPAGKLSDQTTRELIAQLLANLAELTRKMNA
jgi:chromate reductase, NAD(P)H dehydrogenase (quinone)